MYFYDKKIYTPIFLGVYQIKYEKNILLLILLKSLVNM